MGNIWALYEALWSNKCSCKGLICDGNSSQVMATEIHRVDGLSMAGFPRHTGDPHETGQLWHQWYNLYYCVLPAELHWVCLVTRQISTDCRTWQNLDLGQVSRQKVGQAHDSTCSLDAKSPWQPVSATLKLRQTSSVKACTFNFVEILLIFLNHFESFSARWWISGGRQPKRARQKEGWIFTLGELGVDYRS